MEVCVFTRMDHLLAFLAGVRSKFNSIIYKTRTLLCPNWVLTILYMNIEYFFSDRSHQEYHSTAKSIANNFCANIFTFCACLTIKVIISFLFPLCKFIYFSFYLVLTFSNFEPICSMVTSSNDAGTNGFCKKP